MSETSQIEGDAAPSQNASSSPPTGATSLGEAKQGAADATAEAQNLLHERKNQGAERMSGLARAAREAAERFDHESPTAARCVRQAADRIDRVSDTIRHSSLDQLMHDVADFARRQPVAFFGASVLAGVALSRVLKSANGSSPTSRSHTQTSS
jgi:hypothetical protein